MCLQSSRAQSGAISHPVFPAVYCLAEMNFIGSKGRVKEVCMKTVLNTVRAPLLRGRLSCDSTQGLLKRDRKGGRRSDYSRHIQSKNIVTDTGRRTLEYTALCGFENRFITKNYFTQT